MKFVSLIHYFFFFIFFFEIISVITRIFLIELISNKNEMSKIFETHKRAIYLFEMLIFIIFMRISNIENEQS